MPKALRATLALAFALSALVGAEEYSDFSEIHDLDLAWSFGWALAMSEDVIAVGDNDFRSGSVWIFERSRRKPSRFNLVTKLKSPTAEDAPYFGRRLEIDDHTLVVKVGFSDSVLIFSREKGGRGAWKFAKKLREADEIAVDGDLLALAVGGDRVDIHQRDLGGESGWRHLTSVRPIGSDEPFAAAVSISGGTLAVGSAFDACGSWTDICSDGYRIFEQRASDPTSWRQVLHKPGEGFGDHTGSEVLVDGSTLVSTDGIRERRRGRWDLVAPAPLVGLSLRQHSMLHLGRGGGSVVLDRRSTPQVGWHPVGDLLVEDVSCGKVVLGPRELVVACPHGDSPDDHGTVRVYPRAPLFSHGFERANLSGWTRVNRKVSLSSPGLRGSQQALAVELDGSAKKSFVRTRRLDRQPSVSLDFSLSPNGVRLGGESIDIVHLAGRGSRQVKLTMRKVEDRYRIDLWARQPGAGFVRVGGTRIPPEGGTRLGIEWRRANSSLVSDGVVRLKKKGRLVAERHDLATDQETISVMTLGLPAGSRGTQRGTVLFDSVVVHR